MSLASDPCSGWRRPRDGRAALLAVGGPLGPRRVRPRLEHGVHRRERRERGAAGAPAGAGRRRLRGPVDRGGLRAVPVLARSRRGLARRPLRPEETLLHRRRVVRPRFARVRSRARRGRPHRRAGRAGARGRPARALEPRDARRRLSAAGTRTRRRHVVRADVHRERRRSGPRRVAGRGDLVARRLPDQPSHRRRRAVDRAAARRRDAQSPREAASICRERSSRRSASADSSTVSSKRPSVGWADPRAWGAAAAGVAGLCAFVVVERNSRASDGFAESLSPPDVRDRQSPDALSLRRAGGDVLLSSLRADPGARLPAVRGRRGDPAARRDRCRRCRARPACSRTDSAPVSS